MIFYYAKKEGNCLYCKGKINRNDFCVKQFLENKDTGFKLMLTFHYDCFIPATIEHITKEANKFISQHTAHPKSGRPCKYTDGKTANNLKNLIKYYHKQGNTTKVLELEIALSRLIQH